MCLLVYNRCILIGIEEFPTDNTADVWLVLSPLLEYFRLGGLIPRNGHPLGFGSHIMNMLISRN